MFDKGGSMSTGNVVKDIMIGLNEYPHISSDISIREAIEIIRKSILEGRNCFQPMIALVVNKEGLVGTLRLRDILKALEPEFLTPAVGVQGYKQDSASLTVLWD